MSISFGAAGASSSAAESVTPALPAGAAAGMLAVLQVVSGHQDDAVPTAPSGWTLVGSAAGGGGAFGAAAGPRRLTFFVRELLASTAAPTVSIPAGGTGSTIAARICTLSRSAGAGWRWAVSFGEDTSSGTGFSAAGGTALSWKAGDVAVIGYGVPLSTAAFSAEAIAAAGVTFGTVTERADDSISAGHDSRFVTATGAVSSGTATQAPTLAATLSAASTGVAGVLRIREASSAVAATAQNVFPPRNLVSVTGLAGDDVVTASIYRQVGSDRLPVRAADGVDVSATDVLLRVDAEQPFGVPLAYAAVLTDAYGQQWTVTSGSLTSTVSADVISDAIRGIGAAVKVESPLEWSRSRDASKFNVGGRIVVVGKRRSQPSTTMTVRTVTDADGDALNLVLDDLTEGVLLFRKQSAMPRLDGYYALSDDNEAPNWYDEVRWFQLEVQRTQEWAPVLEAAGFTLQDIADNFATLQDLAAAFTPGSLLTVALFDFGS